jgi:hypothetical protein
MYLSTAFPSFSPFFASFNILPPAPEKSLTGFLDGAGGAFSEAFSGFPSRAFSSSFTAFSRPFERLLVRFLVAVCARHGQNVWSQALAVARILSAMPRLP